MLLSTPVGPLGSGLGGGVELTVEVIALGLRERRHEVVIVAPSGSVCDAAPIVQVPGSPQIPLQTSARDASVTMPRDPVVAAMVDAAANVAGANVIVNCAYDWLPFWAARHLTVPVAHLVSMGSLSDAMDEVIGAELQRRPRAVAVHSRAQAATFAFGDRLRVLGNGLDLRRYEPCLQPQNFLAHVGRISPEKGIEDVVALAALTGIEIVLFGIVQDPAYLTDVLAGAPGAPVRFEGFVPNDELHHHLRHARALVMTPRWIEAFGNVAMEALACGVPVIAYARGGPAEIITDGVTGFLVEPDSIDGLVAATAHLGDIDRLTCRRRAEEEYSLGAMAGRVESWLQDVVATAR